MVITKTYTQPAICEKEILRYAGCKGATDESLQFLLNECLKEVLPKLSYKICYITLPLELAGATCDFGCMKVKSQDLAKNLKDCEKVVLFAATVGVEIDRLIKKYGAISPAKAVLLQAIGAERIESLCDTFCEEIRKEGKNLCPRFSAGYGDLPLETQKDIFQILNCNKNIGLSLNDSLMMSPSKSVTAFIGIKTLQHTQEEEGKRHNCSLCKKTDCIYKE